jgi:SNF2 family DNA or RNA helicase
MATDDWNLDPEGRVAQIHSALANILLRRTMSTIINGQPIVQLPPARIENVHVDLNDMEQRLYAAVENFFQAQYLEAGAIRPSVTRMLTLLRRLQQACCHPFLIPELQMIVKKASEDDDHRAFNASSFAEEVVTRLRKNERSLGDCPICFDTVKNPLILWPCGHSICDKCFGMILSDRPECPSLYGDEQVRCPMCRMHLDPSKATDYDTLKRYHMILETPSSTSFRWYMPLQELLHPSSEQSGYPSGGGARIMMNWFADSLSTDVPVEYNLLSGLPSNPVAPRKNRGHGAIVRQRHHCALSRQWISSSKIDKALDIIQQIRETAERGKVIVFSQFTSLLDFLEIPLRQRCWTFCRYDGSMKPQDRHRAVQEYVDNSECAVMLVSLRAGNSGLNLTVASHVIILDPSWNPSVEDQAIGRVYRIGQHKPVHIRRLLVPNTVEDRIQDLQEQKRNLTSCILEDGFTARSTQPDRNDLEYVLVRYCRSTQHAAP